MKYEMDIPVAARRHFNQSGKESQRITAKGPALLERAQCAGVSFCTSRCSKTMSVKGEKKWRLSFIAHFTRSESNALQLFISLKFHGTSKSIQRERSSLRLLLFHVHSYLCWSKCASDGKYPLRVITFVHRSNYSSLSLYLKSFNGGVMRL